MRSALLFRPDADPEQELGPDLFPSVTCPLVREIAAPLGATNRPQRRRVAVPRHPLVAVALPSPGVGGAIALEECDRAAARRRSTEGGYRARARLPEAAIEFLRDHSHGLPTCP